VSEKKSEGMKQIEEEVEQEIQSLEEAEKAKFKTLSEILSDDPGPKEAYVPALKCKIKFHELKFGDYPALAEEKDPFKLAVKTLLLTWGRADSSVTEENLARLGLVKCTRILEALGLGGARGPLSKPTQTSSI